MKINKKWFTLVELIVVITVLAILSTLWFLALSGYNKDARDSKRLADMSNLGKSMELFFAREWVYPDPSLYTIVTYSWAEAWKQWTISDDIIWLLWDISYKPVDPLTQAEYTYSLLNTWEKYEIWALLEWNLAESIITNTYAASKRWASLVKWNFNKALIEVSTGWLTYALAIPTIIASDISNPDIMSIVAAKKLAYNGYKNIPSTYTPFWYQNAWWFDFNSVMPSTIVVYQWTNVNELSSSWWALKTFSDKLQLAYSWTTISTTWIYKQILWVDTTNTQQINTVISPLINQSLWLSLATTNSTTNSITPSCATTAPSLSNSHTLTVTTWIPTIENQAWQYTNPSSACYFKCEPWFGWINCSNTCSRVAKNLSSPVANINDYTTSIDDSNWADINLPWLQNIDNNANAVWFDDVTPDYTAINLWHPLTQDTLWQTSNPNWACYVLCDGTGNNWPVYYFNSWVWCYD